MNFSGVVVDGRKLGRQIGFPTANLERIHPHSSFSEGAFAVSVRYDGINYLGVMNIGKRPTVNNVQFANQNLINETTIEVHILDFDKQIYGHTLEIKPLEFIRKEKTFNNLGELKAQILKDIEFTRGAFSEMLHGII
ncbi:MAG TPA: riboflavin kinase [Chondromyces sp.]|nr:riboflavin kinase [Chondromyces sp.]